MAEDDFTAIYEYGNYNWNIPGLENEEYSKFAWKEHYPLPCDGLVLSISREWQAARKIFCELVIGGDSGFGYDH